MPCADPAILNLWHVLAAEDEIPASGLETTLLEERITLTPRENSLSIARKSAPDQPLPVKRAFGYFWTSLGDPGPLFDIPEYAEPDRRNLNAGTVGVRVSAPRAIENFLDMGHFPFVHTGILGEEPHTEVKDYNVEVGDEVRATECLFYQPMAAATAAGGMDVEYVYRVPHPYCSVLYKSSGLDPSRMDVIALFVQPMTEESVRAHMLLSLLDDANDDTAIRDFQLRIFGQDKPILENQYPKRLPLDPRSETPIRADKTSVAYRRWLTARGVRYGVIPAAA
jgi:phenylpropionate dioxygenase-like ring-hydroxylating dioxygenase large terminal subunit